MPILMVKSMDMSLEDVFLQITGTDASGEQEDEITEDAQTEDETIEETQTEETDEPCDDTQDNIDEEGKE